MSGNEANSVLTSVKSLPFSGDKDKYDEWSHKVVAYLKMKDGAHEALTTQMDMTNDEQKKKNETAFNLLTQSCTGNAFLHVQAAEDGSACTAWTSMEEEYSDHEDDYTKLANDFAAIDLEHSYENPYAWFNRMKLKAIKIKKVKPTKAKDDDDMMAHALLKLKVRPEYKNVTTTWNMKKPEEKTYSALKKAVCQFWEENYEHKEEKGTKQVGSEALNVERTGGSYKKFKGTCNKCGKYGHKAADCWSKKNNDSNPSNNNGSGGGNKKKFNGKCFNCGERGHIARNCTNKASEANGMFVGNVETIPRHEFCKTIKRDELSKIIQAFDFEPMDVEEAFYQAPLIDSVPDLLPHDNGYYSSSDEESVTEDIEETEATDDDDSVPPPLVAHVKADDSSDDDDDSVPPPLVARTEDYDSSDDDYSVPPLLPRTEDSDSSDSDDDDYAVPDSFFDPWVPVHRRSRDYVSFVDDDGTASEFEFVTYSDVLQAEGECFALENSESVAVGAGDWLMDNGATNHFTNDVNDLTDVKQCSEPVKAAIGPPDIAKHKGTTMLEQKGTGAKVKLDEVLCVPQFPKKIMSLAKLIENGATVNMTKDFIEVKQNGLTLCSTKKRRGLFYFESVARSEANDVETTQSESIALKLPKSMDIMEAHDKLAHISEVSLRKTLKWLGIKPTGSWTTCDGCARAKARQKALRKVTDVKASGPYERMFLDTSGPFAETPAGSRYWGKLLDDWSGNCDDFYMKAKSQVPKKVDYYFTLYKSQGHQVKYLRCDNAGEHQKKLKEVCMKHGVILEYTASNTPQHNGRVERRFATDGGRALAMMIAAGLDEPTQQILWAEATNTASKLTNLVSNSRSDEPPNSLLTKEKSKIYSQLMQWGRVAYVAKRDKLKRKFVDRSKKCIFVGYSEDHASDVWRLYDPTTKSIITPRDIEWADWVRRDPKLDMDIFEGVPDTSAGMPESVPDLEEDDADEPDAPHVIPPEPSAPQTSNPETGRTIGGQATSVLGSQTSGTSQGTSGRQMSRVERELQRLNTSYNPTTIVPQVGGSDPA